MIVRPMGAELSHADRRTHGRTDKRKDGRTDRHDETNSRFSIFAKAHKKYSTKNSERIHISYFLRICLH